MTASGICPTCGSGWSVERVQHLIGGERVIGTWCDCVPEDAQGRFDAAYEIARLRDAGALPRALWQARPMRDFLHPVDKAAHQRQVDDALGELAAELQRAKALHEDMYSPHEGIGIIREELNELEDHVWLKGPTRDLEAMRAEAIQLATVALRFAIDVCNEPKGRR